MLRVLWDDVSVLVAGFAFGAVLLAGCDYVLRAMGRRLERRVQRARLAHERGKAWRWYTTIRTPGLPGEISARRDER